MPRLETGDKAPAFTLRDQDGAMVKLSDFKGKKLLLYFYPRADTPGCTRQSCAVRDAKSVLARKGVAAIGISPDKPEALKKFDGKYGLGFPLLADPDHTAAEAFGVWVEKSMYGKTSMGILRSSFLLDEAGKVIGAWYRVKPEDTVPKALGSLG